MAPRDRHGKTAQDYRESLITTLDSIAPRPRARRGHPLLWIWLLVPLAALWLNWTSVQGYFFRRVPFATGISAAVTPAVPASVYGPELRGKRSHSDIGGKRTIRQANSLL